LHATTSNRVALLLTFSPHFRCKRGATYCQTRRHSENPWLDPDEMDFSNPEPQDPPALSSNTETTYGGFTRFELELEVCL
jgi:hypothetical protein